MDDSQDAELLRQSEERHRLLAEHANDVVWTLSPDGLITYISPAVEAMRGFTPEEAMNQSLEQIHPPESQAVNRAYFERLGESLQNGTPPEEFQGELEYYCKDGSTVWTHVQVIPHMDENGQLVEILGVSRDISEHKRFEREIEAARQRTETANEELKQANEKLERLATTDDLTGSFNRRHCRSLLESATAESERPLTLLMIDIDHFKKVNDSFGHVVGDRILVELTRTITGVIRETDVLSRWGGDEFIVLMPLCDADEASTIAERICQKVASERLLDTAPLTVSIGVSQAREGEDMKDWVARADSALYQAKEAGRGRVVTAQAG